MKRLVTSLVIVLLSALAGGGFMMIFTEARAPSQTARAVLVVPPAPSQGTSGDPDASAQLASTYAAILERSAALVDLVASASGTPRAAVESGLQVNKVGGAALIDVALTADSERAARSGVRAALEAITAGNSRVASSEVPASASIAIPAGRALVSPTGQFRSRGSVALSANADQQPDPTGANKLAANLAALIPENESVLAATAQRIRADAEYVRSGLRVTNTQNTSLIVLSFTATSYDTARRAVTVLAEQLTRSSGSAGLVPPRALEVVRRPDDRVPEQGSIAAIAAGVVIGFAIGVGFLALRRRRDPRVTDRRVLQEVVAVPVGEVSKDGSGLELALRDVLSEHSDGRVELVAAAPLRGGNSTSLAERFRADPDLSRHLIDAEIHAAPRHNGAVVLLVPDDATVSAVRMAQAAVHARGSTVIAGLLVR